MTATVSGLLLEV